jgi:hypothetical protein
LLAVEAVEAVEHAVLKRLTVLPLFTALVEAAVVEDRQQRPTHLAVVQVVGLAHKTCMVPLVARVLSAVRAAVALAVNISLRHGLAETAGTAVGGALAVLVGPADALQLILREEPVAVAQPYLATETSHGWRLEPASDQFRKEET